MKKIITIILALIVTTTFAQNKTDSQGRKQGQWQKYNKDTLIYKGQFKDDVPYGVFNYFHPDGSLKSTTEFVNGVTNVKTTMYYSENKKASEGAFTDQLKDGEWKYWSEQGFLVKEENYKRGVKHGTWNIYMNNSDVLLSSQHYIDGKRNGLFTTYYTNGKVSTKDNYINDMLNGNSELYLIEGELYSKGQYHKGFKIGKWDFYDKQKKLRKEVYYTKSMPDSMFLHFYSQNKGVRIEQGDIAYFIDKGRVVDLVTLEGAEHILTDDMATVKEWTDFIAFCPVLPNLYAGINAIESYEEIDAESIRVKLKPAPIFEVISQGDEMKAVIQLFNTDVPTEE